MKNRKTTRRALFSSVISLILCCAMLVGTTFAWFTDEVKSGINTITAGNLDVELYHDKANEFTDLKKSKVDENTLLFTDANGKEIDHWEPGVVAFTNLKVANVGSLALKYQLSVNSTETNYVEVDGVQYTLADALQIAVVPEGVTGTREEVIAAVDEWEPMKSFTLPGVLEGETTSQTYGIVVYWQPGDSEADNLFNMNNGKKTNDENPLNITLGVNVFATQEMYEDDSFGPDYDEDAWHNAMKVTNEQDLNAAIANGETAIVLENDIELTGPIVIPASATTYDLRSNGFAINLNGKTLSNPNGYVIENYGDVTITGNGTVSGMGGIRSHSGSVLIENGNFYASSKWQNGNYQHTLKAENTNVVINGGNFDATVNGQSNAMIGVAENAVVTINGGAFKNVAGELSEFDPYLFNYEKNGKVIINNGTFYGGWRFNGETATTDICGGTFTVGFDGQSFHANSTHVVTVYGGTFVSGKLIEKLNDLVADGYQTVVSGDGTYTVVPEVENVKLSATNFAGIYAGDTAKTYYVFNKTGLMNLNSLFRSGYSGEGVPTIINLEADVDLTGEDWKPLDAMWITFNGNGHTISNLTASGMDAAGRRSGFWGYAGAVTINDLTLENVTVNGSQAGIFAGSTEGTRINKCFLKGNNVVNFVAGVEEWNGIGAICGIASTPKIDVTIVDGATVTLNRGDMVTAFDCTYIDDLIGHLGTNSGTITNNGTVTATGSMAYVVSSAADLKAAVANGATKVMLADGQYDLNGVEKDGLTLIGVGENVKMANTTRFANGNAVGAITKAIHLENMTITNTVYTMENGSNATFTNVNFAAGFRQGYGKAVVFDNCSFGSNSEDYALHFQTDNASKGGEIKLTGCEFEGGKVHLGGKRAYTFSGCDFAEGTDFQVWSNITLENCTVNGVKVTSENMATLFPELDATKVTIK